MLKQQHVDHTKHKRHIGLGLDWHPFGRRPPGYRQMRLDLNPFSTPRPGLGVAPGGTGTAGSFQIGAKRQYVVGIDRIGANGKAAVPVLTVEVLGVGASNALSGAKTEINRPTPGSQESR